MSCLTIFNQSSYKPQFQIAYEYLNNIKLEIRGLKSSIELEVNDIVCIVGISELTNILLTRIGVCCLLPRRSCGFIPNESRNSNVLVIDAGNRIDLYQYVEFATVWIGYRTSFTKSSGNKSFYIISACASNSL